MVDAGFALLAVNGIFSIYFNMVVVFTLILDFVGLGILGYNNGFTSHNPATIWEVVTIFFSLGAIVICAITIAINYLSNKDTFTAYGMSFVIKVFGMSIFFVSKVIFAIIGIFIVPINYSITSPNAVGNMAVAILFFQWLIIILSIGIGVLIQCTRSRP